MPAIVRRDLVLDSSRYSREHGIDRSIGCHLMQVVDRIVARETKQSYDDWSEEEREGVRTPGFVWERTMSDHAYEVNRQRLVEPGEMFWCEQCDETMAGGTVAAYHCRAYKHRGIFFTPDFCVIEEEGRPAWFPLECKLTWKSSRRTGADHLDGMPGWRYQLMWQAMGLDSDRGQIQSLFVRGDYSQGKPKVEGYVFDLRFTEKELKKNKTLVLCNAKAEGLL